MDQANIDTIDAVIITELLKNARKSFAEIAQECSVSKTSISDHYKDLEKVGVIVGATIQMDYKIFGYNAVMDAEIRVDPQQFRQVADYIKTIPNIYSVYPTLNPQYNLQLVATLKTLKELDHVKDAIGRQKPVSDFKAHIWTGIRNIPENLDILPYGQAKTNLSDDHVTKNVERNESEVGEIDLNIVQQLAQNSREPFRNISQKIGTSTDTVARRYKKMVARGIIKTCIQIDPRKIGYHAIATFKIAIISESNTSTIIDSLTKIPNLTLIIKKSGGYNMHVYVMIKNIDQLLAIQEKIFKVSGIIRLETIVGPLDSVRVPWPSPKQYISTF